MNYSERYKRIRAKKYSNLAIKAIQHGVSREDLIMETTRYHGEDFASFIAEQINEMF